MAPTADQIGSPGQLGLSETILRLSSKAGVKATVVLDRGVGSILQTTGNISPTRAPSATRTSQSPDSISNAINDSDSQGDTEGLEELAAMVWKFVNAAGGLVQGLDPEDEVKLLRLRTKKHELVIVPDTKYLLIVVHETSPV